MRFWYKDYKQQYLNTRVDSVVDSSLNESFPSPGTKQSVGAAVLGPTAGAGCGNQAGDPTKAQWRLCHCRERETEAS